MNTKPTQMPDQIYAWRHGDDEPINGMWLECDDPANPADAKYIRAETAAPVVDGDVREALAALKKCVEAHERFYYKKDGGGNAALETIRRALERKDTGYNRGLEDAAQACRNLSGQTVHDEFREAYLQAAHTIRAKKGTHNG